MPVIGLLQIGAPSSWNFTGFRQGLKDMGYLEGQNLMIEFRWADNDLDRLPELASDLVHRQRTVATCFSKYADGMGLVAMSASRRPGRGSAGKAAGGCPAACVESPPMRFCGPGATRECPLESERPCGLGNPVPLEPPPR